MVPEALNQRIELLIDDLIEDGGVATATLASIIVAALDAIKVGHHVALCRRVWSEASALESAVESRLHARAAQDVVGRSG